MTSVFQATVRNGKLFLDKAEQWKQYLASFPNEKRVEVTVEKVTHSRTNNQNRYYWGVVVKTIAEHTGQDDDTIHQALKLLFLPRTVYIKDKAFNLTGSTTSLDTHMFVEYTEKCRLWANEFLGLQIPLPGEVTV